MALPASEDTGLLIAASVVSVGHFDREPGSASEVARPGDRVRRHPSRAEWATR